MKVSILVNGLFVEGVKPSSIKFSVSNADPLKFSERTVTYSATVDVPRTAVNDRIFRAERAPHVYTRNKVYVCNIAFDGLPSPVGGTVFKARVSADVDGYKLELIEQFTKLSDVGQYLGALTPVQKIVEGYRTSHNYKAVLARVYGTVNMPAQMDDGKLYEMCYIDPNQKINTNDYAGTYFSMAYTISFNGAAGTEYPRNELIVTDTEIATILARSERSIQCRVNGSKSKIIMPQGSTAGLELVLSGSANTVVPFVARGTNPDGTVNYTPQANTLFGVGGSSPTAQLKGALRWVGGAVAKPASSVPAEEAVLLSMRINRRTGADTEVEISTRVGFNKGFDIVQAFCKAFCWTYDYSPTEGVLTLREFINPDAITNPSSVYRRKIEGKIDESSVVVSEIEGVGRSLGYKVGELSFRFRVFEGAVDNESEGAESAFPVTAKSDSSNSARMVNFNGVSETLNIGYFTGNSPYRQTISNYYRLFSKGYQVKCKANLTWFDMKNFKNDACYLVSELNGWFYIRSISNWNPEDGSCTLTLISLNM